MALAKSQQSLKNWGKQKWRTKSGKPSSKTGERYLPSAAIKSLSSSEYARTTAAKRKGKSQGKTICKTTERYSKQSKKVQNIMAEKIKENQFDEVGVNPFNAPIPGESLTTSPDMQKAWERPPKYVEQDKAIEAIYMELTNEDTLRKLINYN